MNNDKPEPDDNNDNSNEHSDATSEQSDDVSDTTLSHHSSEHSNEEDQSKAILSDTDYSTDSNRVSKRSSSIHDRECRLKGDTDYKVGKTMTRSSLTGHDYEDKKILQSNEAALGMNEATKQNVKTKGQSKASRFTIPTDTRMRKEFNYVETKKQASAMDTCKDLLNNADYGDETKNTSLRHLMAKLEKLVKKQAAVIGKGDSIAALKDYLRTLETDLAGRDYSANDIKKLTKMGLLLTANDEKEIDNSVVVKKDDSPLTEFKKIKAVKYSSDTNHHQNDNDWSEHLLEHLMGMDGTAKKHLAMKNFKESKQLQGPVGGQDIVVMYSFSGDQNGE